MAGKYRWPDGKMHSIPYSQHVQNLAAQSPNITPFSQALVSQGPGQPQVPVSQYVQQQQAAQGGPPPDPALMQQQAQANFALGLGNAWDTYNTGKIENEFGLGADVSNPFSRAALLQAQYQNNQRATGNSFAQRVGGTHQGAYQSAKDYNARQYSINYDQLKRSYQNAKDSITQGKIDRYSQYGSLSGADLSSLLKQLGLG